MVYVDKTRWIYKLLTEGETYFFSRPRRFGKSLTISTLKELFKGNKDLFKGLWIYDKWEFKEHPVIVFDFNQISNISSQILEENLRFFLKTYYNQYKVPIPQTDHIQLLLRELIISLFKKQPQK